MVKIIAIFSALGLALLFTRRSYAAPASASPAPTNTSNGGYFPVNTNTDTRPRGIRNNNPTNIIDVGIPWLGKTGNDGRYVIFSTPIFGLRAGFLNLWSAINTHNADTIRTLIYRWAPPTENLTGAYQMSVVRQTGLTLDQKLNYQQHAKALIRAIVTHENGQNPYSDAQYDQAYAEAGK